uniref:phosphoethanolamine N-methyltransferase n=1 Tax=Globodera rostochiensis TaxID=31243 RepID=A0A914HY38_GLORO
MPQGSDERQKYLSFWDQFSGRADNSAMMLNANADQIEALDRANILALLPSVNGKFVVDIGAGIGRFTTVFAQSEASRVVATDFVHSFVEKNRERNSEYANVEWRVGDATGLQFDEGSVDLVFTNWLLMYMSDEEVVQFVANALQWLRPDGYLHLRESCSEPSTKKSVDNSSSSSSSLHNKSQPNPTRYRLSSAYIQLLRNIRHIEDESGKIWRFDVQWACSVGVYIERQLNWRQVHWLARKVPATDNNTISIPKSVETLAKQFADKWPAEQKEFDHRMDVQKPGWMQKALDRCLDEMELNGDGIMFGFSGRKIFTEFGVDAEALTQRVGRRIWAVETDPFAYRHALTRANQCGDRRVRLAWHFDLESALDFWGNAGQSMPMFEAVVGTEMLAQLQDERIVNKFARMLGGGAQIASVELVKPGKDQNDKFRANLKLLRSRFIVNEEIEVDQLDNGYKILIVMAKLQQKEKRLPRFPAQQKDAINTLLGGCPVQFCDILKRIDAMEYRHAPDYDDIENMMGNIPRGPELPYDFHL